MVVITDDDCDSIGSGDDIHESSVVKEYGGVLKSIFEFCQDGCSSECFGCTCNDDVDFVIGSDVDFC